MKAIVNADDLGMSRAVNDAIFWLMAEGRVTSATLLVNGEAAVEAARGAQAFSQCSFGVHLNASEFRPLSGPEGLGPILDARGCFACDALGRVRITPALREGIFREFSAQIEHARALGLRVSHLDSHHHIHTVPGIFPVLKRVQRRFDIRKVRITKNIYSPRAPTSRKLLFKKALWNLALRRYYRTTTTDGFTSLADFLDAVGQADGRHRTMELMVHPGSNSYVEETRRLAGDWRAGMPFPIELISYDQLGD